MDYFILRLVLTAICIAVCCSQESDDCNNVVCVYRNYIVYAKELGRFTPRSIEPDLCTHIHVWYASVKDGKVVQSMPDDVITYEQVLKLRLQKPSLKVMITIGGPSTPSMAFHQVAQTSESRRMFIENLIDFVKIYGFDGFNLYWHTPTKLDAPFPEDKFRFVDLLMDLRMAVDKDSETNVRGKLSFVATFKPGTTHTRGAYAFNELGRYVDYALITTLNFHGQWDGYTGFSSPLYPAFKGDDANIEATMKLWVDGGFPKGKMVMGLYAGAQTYTLPDSRVFNVNNYGTGLKARAGRKMDYSNLSGKMTYFELCQLLRGDEGRPHHQVGRIAVSGDQWCGYDDPMAIHIKAQYLRVHGAAGVFLWALDMDDYTGKFCSVESIQTYPLHRALNACLFWRKAN